MRQAGVVFNPVGGSFRPHRLAELVRELGQVGIKTHLYPTTAHPQSARQLVEQAVAAGMDIVIPMGGDGTVAAVAAALAGSDVPLAAYPGGTSNIFVRAHYRCSARAFARMVATPCVQPLDLIAVSLVDKDSGQLVERRSIQTIGTGTLAGIAARAQPRWKRLFGPAAYVGTLLSHCPNFATQPCEFRVGGQSWREASSLALIMNVPYPRAYALSPGCSAFDGHLDVVNFRAHGFLKFMRAGASIALGMPQRCGLISRYRASAMEMLSDQPFHVNVDGELLGRTTHAQFRVLAGAVNAVVSAAAPVAEQ
jgi:diacylglycerol kinase family enzyme